jgi:hypothetical protein
MEVTVKRLDENQILLAIFSMMVTASIVLMLFKPLELSLIPRNPGTTEFQVILTPGFIIVKNTYSNAIAPYIISESGSIRTDLFPLKLPRVIEAYNKTIKIKMWGLKIRNVLLLKNIEVNEDGIVQKAHIVDLLIHLREEESSNSSFKLVFENIETPRENASNDGSSGTLGPLTAHLYGSFYSTSKIKITITWEPADKPIFVAMHREKSESQKYLLTNGEWSGFLDTLDGLNCLVIGNPSQLGEVKYSLVILN